MDAEGFTPQELTTIFQRHGHLAAGMIIGAATSQTFESPTAWVTLIQPTYSEDAAGDLPARLALKRFKPGTSAELISREVTFYSKLVPTLGDLPIVHRYAAEHDPETGDAYLLLEDRSGTHDAGTLVSAGSAGELQAVVEALARLHAALWDHTYVVEDLLPQTVESFIDDFGYHRGRLVELSAILGDRLPSAWHSILSTFIDRGRDLLLSRLQDGSALTLAHSDPHFGNVLFPRDPGSGQALLIDFAFTRAWWGARDVAFTLAFAADPPVRRAVEHTLVRHYHDRLLEQGVKGYGWEQCWHDYRLGVITNLRVPLGSRKAPYVWYRLERAIQAYLDLECEELLVAG